MALAVDACTFRAWRCILFQSMLLSFRANSSIVRD
jgi:hypothetical protein